MAARGLMCLALVLGLLAAAASAQYRFEDITRQAWERHQAYLADGVYKSDPDAPAAARTHKCVHSELMNERTRQARFRELRKRQDPSSPANREAMAKRSVRQTTPQPIRFYSDTRLLDSTTDSSTCYTAGSVVDSYQVSQQTITCNSNALVTDSVRNYLKLTVIPTTVSMFQSLLRVTPRTGNLVVGVTDLCSDLAASFATSVPNADYYMFFSARAVLDSSTIATAETCSTDPTDGHPFVGLVNFNPASFQSMPSNYFDFQYALRVAMHEFTHALGFSTGLYSSYRNSSGLPYPALTFPMSGSVYTGIATPRVLNWARNYFNCPTLSAMPLEDDGGAGTQGSHWEQKAVYSEYMVGIATQFFAISNLTLNLLADSGWYTPDFSKAEDLGFGWQKGCQFLALPCTDANWNVLGPTEAYECSGTSRGCTADRLAVGVCTATVSSQSLTMPGCNFYSTQSPATFCQANGTEADGVIGDFYCPQCRCFSVRNAATSTAAACFQVQCVAGTNGTQLRVQKGNTWHDCPADGSAGTIRVGSSVPGIDTTIYCPASIEICRQVSIDSARLVPYKKKTGFKWLFTNNSLKFWGMVAGVLIIGMIAICLFMCLCSTLCSCICGGNKGPRNRALMLRR